MNELLFSTPPDKSLNRNSQSISFVLATEYWIEYIAPPPPVFFHPHTNTHERAHVVSRSTRDYIRYKVVWILIWLFSVEFVDVLGAGSSPIRETPSYTIPVAILLFIIFNPNIISSRIAFLSLSLTPIRSNPTHSLSQSFNRNDLLFYLLYKLEKWKFDFSDDCENGFRVSCKRQKLTSGDRHIHARMPCAVFYCYVRAMRIDDSR